MNGSPGRARRRGIWRTQPLLEGADPMETNLGVRTVHHGEVRRGETALGGKKHTNPDKV